VAEPRADPWPLPPHFVEHAAPEALRGAECLALRYALAPVSGRLQGLDTRARQVAVQPQRDPAATLIGFDELRVLRLLQAVTLAELPAAPGPADLRLSPLPRPFSVLYRDTIRESGQTRGFLRDGGGAYLYVVRDDRHCTPWFVPSGSGTVSVGDNLADLFVRDRIASERQLREAREHLARLRAKPLGVYLVDTDLVAPAQLQQALERQRLKPGEKLGDILVREGVLTEEQLRTALERQAADRRKTLPEALVEAGVLTSEDAARSVAEKFGVPFVAVRDFPVTAEALSVLKPHAAYENRVLPLYLRGGMLVAAAENPFDGELLQRLRFLADRPVALVMASGAQIAQRLAKEYAGGALKPGEAAPELAALLESGAAAPAARADTGEVSDSSLVRLVTRIILDAHEQGASDIHIETNPGTMRTRVRLRKDGVLVDYLELPPSVRSAIISRIKIMSDLDISEHRRPQDGKIAFKNYGPADVDLRVAIVPTSGGLEDVVLRVLSAEKPMPVAKLGLSPRNLAEIRRMADKSYGLLLVCGPTGSGKTTTLHSILSSINTPDLKIWTAEDPIEIHHEGLRQVQVNAKIGFTFAAAMRSFLRADPDVIMVGEMRDQETTKIGIEASLTGHLVFSTLHTNSAAESIVRLLDLGMDPFNFADALIGVLAQRLVRRLCAACVQRRPATPAELEQLAAEYNRPLGEGAGGTQALLAQVAAAGGAPVIGEAAGCPSCNGSGYRGRLAIHELLSSDARIRHLIQSRAPVEEVLKAAVAGGMTTLMQDGIVKVLQGLADIGQVRSACS
jgi:type II secretory ATPase GspE/PulE/Tfp pilus assembly ATPase PilB-like protein